MSCGGGSSLNVANYLKDGDCTNGEALASTNHAYWGDYYGECGPGQIPQGLGKIIFSQSTGSQAIYIGTFKDGYAHGQGTLYYDEGLDIIKYEGEFKKGFGLHGIGYNHYRDGRVEKVRMINNELAETLYDEEQSAEEPAESESIVDKETIPDKMDIGEAKLHCKDIGFTEGTEKFGQCVLDLTK